MSKQFNLACVLLMTIAIGGCTPAEMEKINRDLAAFNARNQAQLGAPGRPAPMAVMPEATKQEQTQLIIPTDTRTKDAMEAALPTIKKILSIHQCVQNHDGLLQLNYLAVPGINIRELWHAYPIFPNHSQYMKYHDRNRCVSVRKLDNWSMPALNALRFRAVYFADDSGETVNFTFLMKTMDDGSWRLAEID